MSKKRKTKPEKIRACKIPGIKILHSYFDWEGDWRKDYDWTDVKNHQPPKGFLGCDCCCECGDW